jgi:hypothetical protein
LKGSAESRRDACMTSRKVDPDDLPVHVHFRCRNILVLQLHWVFQRPITS